MSEARAITIGIDVGGTFTDAVLGDGVETVRAKALTTQDDISRGVIDACELLAARKGLTLDALLPSVQRFGLGTTAVTNALASRSGRRVGLITTRGFEDCVPAANGRVISQDGWLRLPWSIAPRRCIAGVNERIDRNGTVLTPLDPAEVVDAARRLVELEGIEALAVSFLWSFRNPAHEDQAVAAIATALPDLRVTSGASLLPQSREYERSTLALLNAYTSGALRGVDELQRQLDVRGLGVPILLMHSAGGSISAAEAHRMPIGLAQSGPAAGVTAAAMIARRSGFTNAISCDMGGTTLDIAVVMGGEPLRKVRGEVMGVWTALSLIDVDSIGAGGGSIAWADALGIMQVGPKSAGAYPGPACYGRGGTQPTVTDALLALGYIDPTRFLGGAMPLDPTAALAACARLGEGIGLEPEQAAWGIRAISLSGMVKAVKSRLVERGLDPAENALVSYGGCGGLFAADIARAIGARTVIFPEFASVFSAFGAAASDIRRERIRAVGLPAGETGAMLEGAFAELSGALAQDLAADGVAPADRTIIFEADMRFRRQRWELSIALTEAEVAAGSLDSAVERFLGEYARRYGKGALMAGMEVELTLLRAIGIGQTVKATFNHAGAASGKGPVAASGVREVRLERDGPRAEIDLIAPESLAFGRTLSGPALLDASDTTIWIPPQSSARVDANMSLVLELEP